MISISEQNLKRVNKFAEEVYETNKNQYSKRGQKNPEKIKRQTAIGKIGEFAVYTFLADNGWMMDEPDLKVYKKKEKSWVGHECRCPCLEYVLVHISK